MLSDQGLSTSLVANLNGLAQNAASALDEENRTVLKQILRDLSEVTKVLAERSGQMDRGVQQAVQAADQSARMTEQLGKQLPALVERLSRRARNPDCSR
ncbi:MAG: hypothetical protein IPM88_20895 [Nitrospira sp.]|nr:hypothetical protein [Nitrospira sp.]